MTAPQESQEGRVSQSGNWAPLVDRLHVSGMPSHATDLVDGRRLLGPLQGFGKMWQKTYRVDLNGALVDGSEATPARIVEVWQREFSGFWPQGNRFYAPLLGIEPGEVALISLSAGPMRLSTGVMVLYSDDESFTLMTPQGHMFAGWITFSSFEEESGCIAQTQVLMRAQDPISELGLIFGGHRAEDRFWIDTLRSLAARFELDATPEVTVVCVDQRRRWREAKNIWHNAGIRSGIYMAGAPFRWVASPFRRKPHGEGDGGS
jgi:hypothetical protein